MKTAIILVGNIRTWDECKDSFQKTFSVLSPDIYLSTYNLQYDHHPFIKGRIADFDDCLLTNEHILQKFNDFNLRGVCIEDKVDITEDTKRMHPSMKDLDICFKQYRKFNIGIQMMKHFENEGKYECVIKTRCDMIYEDFDIIQLLEENNISSNVIIDSGNVFPNDCIFITNRNKMVDISNFMLNEFFNFKYPDSNSSPPHKLLLNSIKESGLNIVSKKIMNCVIRKGSKRECY